MSAVFPSDEPEEEENPHSIIDRIIDRVIGDDPDDIDEEEQ